jgi:hypothetical protein
LTAFEAKLAGFDKKKADDDAAAKKKADDDADAKKKADEDAAAAAAAASKGGETKLDPATNALLQELKRGNADLKVEVETIRKQKDEADKSAAENKLNADITSVLGPLPWRSGSSQKVAFDYIKSRVQKQDDGPLIIDNLPLDKYIEQGASDWLDGLLKPAPSGGAGANSGSQRKQAGTFDSDTIKPGMKPEDRAAAFEAIRQVAALSGHKA